MPEKLIELLNSSSEWWKGLFIIWAAILVLAIIITIILRLQDSVLRDALFTIPFVALFLLMASTWMYIAYYSAYRIGRYFPSIRIPYVGIIDYVGKYNNFLLVAAVMIAIYINVKKTK